MLFRSVWPGNYGEAPLHIDWTGDRVRDDYEIALVKAFVAAGKPVFGICRGLQLINVAFGGSLYQDIPSQLPQAALHGDEAAFELTSTRWPWCLKPGWQACSKMPAASRSTAFIIRASKTWRPVLWWRHAARMTA